MPYEKIEFFTRPEVWTIFKTSSECGLLSILEPFHIGVTLKGPGWSADFLRLFPMSSKVEVTTRLNSWQYWWWFWFCFGWAYYDGFFKKLLCSRNVRVFVNIYTSLRPHGKFGDFIACLIPVAWVINIVFNSNSLLKLAEWQNDTTVFNIRVRARQWYWLYYYDFKNIFNLFTLPKHIGWNSWRCDGFGISKQYSSYLSAIDGRARDFALIQEYWDEKVVEIIKENYRKKQRPKYVINNNAYIFDDKFTTINNQKFHAKQSISAKRIKIGGSDLTTTLLSNVDIDYINSHPLVSNKVESTKHVDSILKLPEILKKLWGNVGHINTIKDLEITSTIKLLNKKPRKTIYDSLSPDTLETFYFDGQKSSKRLLNCHLNIKNSKLQFFTTINPNQTLNLEWWDNRGLTLLLQKRLESPDLVPADFITSTKKIDYRASSLYGYRVYIDGTKNTYIKNYGRLSASYINKNGGKKKENIQFNLTDMNKFSRNRIKPSLRNPVQFSKRLLRVTKTLVLPTLTPLNVMTNSYDVVHSWFLPGLGVKFDCVPGKSTHHLLYIEFEGFFYGQCAEICGRYHHHMPIRIYACNLSYFMVWWSHIGFFKAISLNPYTEFIGSNSNVNPYIHNEPYWTESRSNYIW